MLKGRHPKLDPFVPTSWDIVGKMLDFADLAENSVLVDLGSGDGRLVIEAGRWYGSKSMGVELNPSLVEIARNRARLLRLNNAFFVNADMRTLSLKGVTHVTAYLTSKTLKKIEHTLLTAPYEAIIVTHDYPIPGWRPVEIMETWSSSDARHHRFYKYLRGISAPTHTPLTATRPSFQNLLKALRDKCA